MRKIIRKAGHSKQISLPSEMCHNLGLKEGMVLDVEQIEGKIVITPLGL